jgi:uncharacterized protein (TIRG00374 family)
MSAVRGSRRWLHISISLAVFALLALAAWRFLDFGRILAAFEGFRWSLAGPILLLSLVHLYLKAARFVVLLRPLTRLRAALLVRAYLAGQPATLIPGGIAARAALLMQCGLRPGAASGPILHSSLMDQVMFALATVLAALWYPGARPVALTILEVAGVIGGLLLLRPIRRAGGRLLHALAHRIGQGEHWDSFTSALESIHNPLTISLALLITAAAYLTPVLILQLCLLGLGYSVPFATVILCYTVPSMAGRLTFVPGGLGVTEGGMIGMLSALGGVESNSGAAAATLLRVADSFFQGVFGAVIYVFFWRGREEEQHCELPDGPAPSTTGSEL